MSEQERLFPDEGPPGPAGRTRRERDPLFDALAFVCEIKPAELTASGRGMLNKALKEIRDAGATPEEVLHRSQAYRERFSGTPTPAALARHWASLSTRPLAARQQPAPRKVERMYLSRDELVARARAFLEKRP